MTTNGKESMGEPSFRNANKKGFDIHVNHKIWARWWRAGGNTGAASVTTYFIPCYLDKKYRREDTPVLCRGWFSTMIMEAGEAGEPPQRNALF